MNIGKGKAFGAKRGDVSIGRGEEPREHQVQHFSLSRGLVGASLRDGPQRFLPLGQCPPTLCQRWSGWPTAHGRSSGTSHPRLGNKRLSFCLTCSYSLVHTLSLGSIALGKSDVRTHRQSMERPVCGGTDASSQQCELSLEAPFPVETTATLNSLLQTLNQNHPVKPLSYSWSSEPVKLLFKLL